MKVEAKSRAVLKIDEIGSSFGRKYAIISGRMGDAEPEFTQKVYIGDTLISNLEINVDTDKEKKWDKLHIERG